MKLLRISITPLVCAVLLLLLSMPVFAADESAPQAAAPVAAAPADAATAPDTAAPAPNAAPAEATVAPADAGPAPGSTASMLDAIFIIVGLGFLAATVGYVYACDKA